MGRDRRALNGTVVGLVFEVGWQNRLHRDVAT